MTGTDRPEGPHARNATESAELRRLAHTLDVDPARLAMLAAVPPAQLRALRRQIAGALFEADRPHFARVAALSKTVPLPVAAKLTEATLPPLLAARTAELLEPAKAADLVTRVSERYLADVSAAMDASRAPEVVAAIPPGKVANVASELARRGEWIVIAGFVEQVSEPALRASVAELGGGQLLHVADVMDDASRLDLVGGMLTDTQLDELLAAAPAEGLWRELGTLLAQLSPEPTQRLARRYAAAGPEVTAAYDRAVADGALDATDHDRLTGR
ncbi:hypothetical protein SAMN05443575_1261 [Jatrophihabitans endophyticus]|uniref:Uncharacterized protein n=1 Tax=Jatrophihabitans endophyticus TaxID=1206085 RepID=A0A1M5GR82_9ACTN|nr:hypothetical protein [Jatrophihabitans endophyticus]SHG06141.1 hypothetical protein SAMN05443575_1261 [Jatrophihabitans endophyticus]